MKKVKEIRILIAFAIIVFTLKTEAQGFKGLDNIPHDIAYYRESNVTTPLVKVLYGRPTNSENQEVFGNQIPYNEIWRTGANEATEIKLYNDVVIGGELVTAGTYVLVTIPGENEWEVILSSNTDVLGAFQYNPVFDVIRVKIPVDKAEKLATFSIGFKKVEAQTILMVLGWGSTRVKVPLNFKHETSYFAKL